MAKWIFAATVGVAVLVLLAGDVRAQKINYEVDGCALLARAVYEEVSAAALHGPRNSGPWLIDPQQADIAVCTTAARTVSRAFTSAMRSAGVEVSWGPQSSDSGDFCWSGFLSQCYPNRGDGFSVNGDADTLLVQRSWSVVSQSVMRAMSNPFSSDEVRFRDDELKLRMGLALRSVGAMDDY